MVADQAANLDRVFHALAHPARRAMLKRLAQGEQNLTELAAPLKMTFPAASKHVRVLESAHLVRRHIHGRTHTCRLVVEPLSEVARWTEQCRELWEANFLRLDALLDELQAAERGKNQAGEAGGSPAQAVDEPRARSRRSPVRKKKASGQA